MGSRERREKTRIMCGTSKVSSFYLILVVLYCIDGIYSLL